jgi:hypothetical protein
VTFDVFVVMIIIETFIGYDIVQSGNLLPHSWRNQLSECEGRMFLQTLLAINQTARRHNTHESSVAVHPQKISILIKEISVYKLNYTCN